MDEVSSRLFEAICCQVANLDEFAGFSPYASETKGGKGHDDLLSTERDGRRIYALCIGELLERRKADDTR